MFIARIYSLLIVTAGISFVLLEIYINWISAPIISLQNPYARRGQEEVTHYPSCFSEPKALVKSLRTRVKTCQIQYPDYHISSLEEEYPFAFSILVHK